MRRHRQERFIRPTRWGIEPRVIDLSPLQIRTLKQRSLSGSVRPFQEKCTDDDRACNVLRHAPIAEIVKVQVVT